MTLWSSWYLQIRSVQKLEWKNGRYQNQNQFVKGSHYKWTESEWYTKPTALPGLTSAKLPFQPMTNLCAQFGYFQKLIRILIRRWSWQDHIFSFELDWIRLNLNCSRSHTWSCRIMAKVINLANETEPLLSLNYLEMSWNVLNRSKNQLHKPAPAFKVVFHTKYIIIFFLNAIYQRNPEYKIFHVFYNTM